MADPRRYDVQVDESGENVFIPCPSGPVIKWADFVDYKGSRRRNASEEMNAKLGVEVAHLRAEVERLRKASK